MCAVATRNRNNTYFFWDLPAPVSLNPLAKGLLSIFSCVTCQNTEFVTLCGPRHAKYLSNLAKAKNLVFLHHNIKKSVFAPYFTVFFRLAFTPTRGKHLVRILRFPPGGGAPNLIFKNYIFGEFLIESSFGSFGSPCISKSFGKRIVVNFQLCNLGSKKVR